MPGQPESLSLQEAGLSLSPIGFGCASLMRLPSARARRELIAASIAAGITHFDVARMYGLGAAEGELGRALRDRREQVTIATKFGIDASGALRRLGRLQAPARAVLARSETIRSAVRGRREMFATPRRYDAERASLSLDESLRELGVEHVDILFLHDPRPLDEIEGGRLVEFLEHARRAGKIRAWGSSLDDISGLDTLPRLPARGLVQLRRDVLAEQQVELPSIAFGVMSRHAALVAWLTADAARRRRWSAALDGDVLEHELLATLLLAHTLAQPGVEGLLFATTRATRLAVPARVLGAPPPEGQLRAFAALLAEDRPSIPRTLAP